MKALDTRRGAPLVALAVLSALAAVGCGDLDNVTTVKDLRVLAVKAEPAGFLVPPDDATSLTSTKATLTALVVDPKGASSTVSVTSDGCPDFLDAVTAASGMGSKLCPSAAVTNALPAPLNTLLATTTLPDGTATPVMGSTIEYDPQTTFGISADDLQTFFSSTNPYVASSVQYNRDFGMDAIVDLGFTLGTEKASAIKRVVYWPLLPASATMTIHKKTPTEADGTDCPPGGVQVVNQNPKLTSVDLYRHRVDGAPTDLYADATPMLSIGLGSALFVQPVYDPASIEKYYLRVKNAELGQVVTECHHELLTFQFYATAGTFSPADRRSELALVFDQNTPVRTDSQYQLPATADLPPDGKVTLWVVARDERAGETWSSRTIVVTP